MSPSAKCRKLGRTLDAQTEDDLEVEEEEEDPLVGQLIDERYRVVSRIGAGGMGVVYEGRHEVLGTKVAIKVLHADAAGEEEALARLKREAQAASAIGNEHIVDVRDFGRLREGETYVVMELIDGHDVLSLVRIGALPWTRARDIAVQIAEALEAAHRQGIVHRDLKLENVLLTKRRGKADFVKIVDFGIAKVEGGAKLTIAGRVMGTPEYMSPEQCSGRSVDHRTDIYSLGVMLYEMVTGKLPFYDRDLAKLVRLQMFEKPVPPSRVRPDIELPLTFEAVILRCLAKEPDARFQTMQELAEALSDGEEAQTSTQDAQPVVRDTLPRTSSTPDLDPHPVEPAPSPAQGIAAPTPTRSAVPSTAKKTRPWLWPMVGVIALGTAVGGWALLRASRHEIAPPEPLDPSVAPPAQFAQTQESPSMPSRVDPAGDRSVEIAVASNPSRARVFDPDGALLGETPFRIRRPEPNVRLDIVLKQDGYEDLAVAITHSSAETLNVELRPRERDPRASPRTPATQPSNERPASEGERRREPFLDPWGDEG